MNMIFTLSLAAACLALCVLFGWLGARPPKLLARPRLIPWRFLMLLAFVAMLAVLVHAVTLLQSAAN